MLRGIIAVVTNCTPDNRPVLLLDVGTVVLIARPAAGEGDLFVVAISAELIVDELGAASADEHDRWPRIRGLALFRTATHSVQAVLTSVKHSVQA